MARTLKDYPSVALRSEYLDDKIDFIRVFGRPAPVHIEIGCGKGTFLLNQGRARPDADFLGVERANKYYRYAVDRIGRWGLTNVRIIRTDAVAFLAEVVPPGSVDCFHIYFPDPWPKKRHHKRRFFNAGNLDLLLRVLKQAGSIRVATDHAEYFEVIAALVEASADRLKRIDFLAGAGAGVGEWVGTNFERKYLRENRPIYPLAAEKTQ
jgi:tRNA (guanine-N7-)-methyltransferase